MSGEERPGTVRYPVGSKVWTRLEPLTRNAELTAGVRAEVHDPLWLLGRQWQVGEFRGEDAGSPVDARIEVAHDEVTGLRLGDGDAEPYDPDTDGPLEAVVEREAMTTGARRPGSRQRAEAGQYFRRLLAAEGVSIGPSAFPADLRLEAPDEPLDPGDRRYLSLMAGRTLDGRAVVEAFEADTLSVPDGVDGDAFRRAAAAFVDWYRELYDEPTDPTGGAWDPERFEYRFEVATGEGDEQTVFTAEEYPGGRLDWYAFTAESSSMDVDGADGGTAEPPTDGSTASKGDDDGPRTWTKINRLPTAIDFPGMPAPRWWEFEDSSLNLERLTASPESPARLAMLEFVLVYGNDWFMIPVETPVGSLSRVTTLRITDTFGVETTRDRDGTPRPVPPAVDDDWNVFMARLPSAVDGPSAGLFVPPVVGDVAESEPVERVVLARDEMANLAFGVEELAESAVGTPVDREAFHRPRFAIEAIRPADDPAREIVVLENGGSVELDAAGWSFEVVATDGSSLVGPIDLGGLTVQPGASVTLVMGPSPDATADGSDTDVRGDRYVGAAEPVLSHADAVHVAVREPGEPGRVADRARVPAPDGSLLPAYRLATTVPDHWFPLKPTGPDADRKYRYRLARLLDIDALDGAVAEIPEPEGRVLAETAGTAEEPNYVYEEEVTRAGVELTRSYQLARWLGGSTHLWSGRRARTGRGEGSSGLRFDLLDE